MMTVYFKNAQGISRVIATVDTVSAANTAIKQFIDVRDYISYYWRWWEKDGRTYIDVGSHTELFWIDAEVL